MSCRGEFLSAARGILLVCVSTALAGPLEFGRQQLRDAIAARNLNERAMPRVIEISASSKPESFEITPLRISGGDLRGLMYGLLEAASQIRSKGRLAKTSGQPVVPLRSVRLVLRNNEWERKHLREPQFWNAFLCALAKWRVNRLQLVFGAADTHWSPLYPHLFSLPLFPDVELDGATPFDRGRNMDALRAIAQAAAGCGVDFAIGIQSHNSSALRGITADRVPNFYRAAFEQLLTEIPSIRAVQVNAPPELLREVYIPGIHEAGRLVTLELRESDATEELRAEARNQGVATRVVQQLPAGIYLPALTSLQPSRDAVLRSLDVSRFADPALASLAARGVALGAHGIEVEGDGAFDTAEAALFYSTWGRVLYEPAFVVAGMTPLETAVLLAGRAETAFGRVQLSSPELPAVQLLHSSALDLERAIETISKEHAMRASLETIARRNRFAARRMWSQFMESYYERTKHSSALIAARNELRGALRMAEGLPVAQHDLKQRMALLEDTVGKLSPEDGVMQMPWPPVPRRPSIVHRPFLMSVNDKPLVVPILVAPPAAVTRIRLHYRMLAFAGEFKTLETSPRTPSFTIPIADLRVEGVLLYYFEVQHPIGAWLDPDPWREFPVYTTLIRNPPAIKQERASRD